MRRAALRRRRNKTQTSTNFRQNIATLKAQLVARLFTETTRSHWEQFNACLHRNLNCSPPHYIPWQLKTAATRNNYRKMMTNTPERSGWRSSSGGLVRRKQRLPQHRQVEMTSSARHSQANNAGTSSASSDNAWRVVSQQNRQRHTIGLYRDVWIAAIA